MRGRLPAASVPDVVVDGGWGTSPRANETGPKSTLIALIKDSRKWKMRLRQDNRYGAAHRFLKIELFVV